MPAYMYFNCSCGRSLRATVDQAGTSIRCWQCHSDVEVPRPNLGPRLARDMADSVGELVYPTRFSLFATTAAVLAFSLAVPNFLFVLSEGFGPLVRVMGIVFGVGFLAVGGMLYWEMLRRTGLRRDDWAGPFLTSWRILALRLVIGLVVGAGLFAPFLVFSWGWKTRVSPGAALAIVLSVSFASWVLFPLVLLFVVSLIRSRTLGERRSWLRIVTHPFAILLALVIPPVGFALMESLLCLFLVISTWFPYLVRDMYPEPPNLPARLIQPYGRPLDPTDINAMYPLAYRLYRVGLVHGETLMGAVPASLSVPSLESIEFWRATIYPFGYMVLRVVFTFVIETLVLFLFGLQARWLGLVLTVDPKDRLWSAPRRSVPTEAVS